MTLGQVATRLRVDASQVGKYIRNGVTIHARGRKVRIYLRAGRLRNPRTGQRLYNITPEQLKQFKAYRARLEGK